MFQRPSKVHLIPAATFCISLFLNANFIAAQTDSDARPNIVLMMVDDMGFSDLGCYGGEIETPHIDRLAKNGLRFTQFYNCAKCETTRATLMSGQYYPEVKNQQLKNCITLAEVMKSAGYTTLMTGKWHVADTPLQRGFEKYFGHISGATNFFRGDNTFLLNEKKFDVPQAGFYTTDANVDYAIEFLEQSPREKPFFLYIAFNAPHYPLQAPEKDIKKYRGKYMSGWDQLRKDRFALQTEIGLFPTGTKLTPRPENVPSWDSLDEKEKDHHDLMMSTYAAMIDKVDQNVGRLMKKLEEMNAIDNTLVILLSDNGACPFQRSKEKTIKENLMPWNPDSFWCYDQRWAHACNTPFREYKQNQHEGGINTPLIAHWPRRIQNRGSITHQPGHLVDIMATFVDIGAAKYPKEFKGAPIGKMRGMTLSPIFAGEKREPHAAIFFSFYGKNNAIRVGNWKLVNINFKRWELYDLSNDRTELNDLSSSNPKKLAEMKSIWNKLSTEIGEKKKSKKSNNKANKKNAK